MGKWLVGGLLVTASAIGLGAPAQAQDGRDGWRGRAGGDQQQVQPGGEGRQGGWRNQEQPRAEVEASTQVRERRDGWNGEARAEAPAQIDDRYLRRGWQRSGQVAPVQGVPQPDTLRRDGRDGWGARDRNGDGRPDRWTDRDQRHQAGGQTWRGDGRADDRHDARRDDRRAWWRDGRYDDRGNWNRTWRRDDRFDWNRYRSGHRHAFRLPRYYAPYGWNYGYRRFSIGIALSSALWGRTYWIDDPWSYRLPEAYGPYRWVRYYNDALLVDTRTGTVVDTVYDIFYY